MSALDLAPPMPARAEAVREAVVSLGVYRPGTERRGDAALDLRPDARSGLALRIDRWEDHAGELRHPPRVHRFSEVVYFERGRGTLRVGSQTFEIEPGTVLISGPGLVHDTSLVPDAEGWVVAFLDRMAGASLAPGAFRVRSALLDPGDRRAWSQRLESMRDELLGRRLGYREHLGADLAVLLVELARLEPAPESPTRTPPLVARVLRIIDAGYAKKISLGSVAKMVGRTPSHVATAVRRATGGTVGDLIEERRLSAARRLLADSDDYVDVIAERVGFRDPSYFSRVFRRRHGASPTLWRRAQRAAGPFD